MLLSHKPQNDTKEKYCYEIFQLEERYAIASEKQYL